MTPNITPCKDEFITERRKLKELRQSDISECRNEYSTYVDDADDKHEFKSCETKF